MVPGDPTPFPPKSRALPVQELAIAGTMYVMLPKSAYEELRNAAERTGRTAEAYTAASVGRDLRSRRHRAGLTLAEGAGRAGIRIETLCRLETGYTNPTMNTVRAGIRALGKEDSR